MTKENVELIQKIRVGMVSCIKKIEDAFWDLKLAFVTLKQPSSKIILSRNSATFEVMWLAMQMVRVRFLRKIHAIRTSSELSSPL